MAESCCSVPDRSHEAAATSPAKAAACPQCSARGRRVEWLTVAALLRGRVPAKQAFYLCRTPGCPVVYFGEAGTLLGEDDLNVVPGFKHADEESALVCYCFQHTRGEIAAQLRARGDTDVAERITEEIQAGNCACEVRNPAGKCCLGEVNEAIRALRARLEVPAE